ncbi:glycerol kinase GlpK [Mycoplasmoides genitalium]|uniref:Glycerol kinase n=1 Tax=Mycoplasma genitalium (strain ATCC 33530 / DSM 19775 / NCTC 10195 / G37) TaxID=243273 RepID=GLPK_MYCGE|nr:glycerol kinase GlpK [Mycoplasmoides genitalium]P47284.1 RecName: Full=Glycerol kinase; AltName: Full=ATP:glycerol 3-phosphotransferase; AltName: Full=Glycerokinase; Short=GK [Mycoplasmoides genitalium G37]AAC71254.1 glycerol kinase [Mycoplasmoides genitalium G37]ABY79632.1 glycerol kinase [synthetic Mycoplasma genitalium JCVI-1.0]AFQ02845.1 glycerol kinase [Mycoplasmoides genitalium M2321]
MDLKKQYIIALDEGTSSCRSIVFDHNLNQIAIAQNEFNTFFPNSGWVEQDPLEIWSAQLATMQSAKNKAQIKSHEVIAVGITNQRETIVLWNKENGLPVYNAIVWQDQRTAALCQKFNEDKLIQTKVKQKTGLPINPYFSATKIAWILKNVPLAKKLMEQKKLLFGTIDSWLIWKLTNGKMHVTDVSNASRTLLFDIVKMEWSKELCDLFEVPVSILPKVLSSNAYFGDIETNHWSSNAKGIVPIRAVLGDQQAALFGQLCTEPGMVKNTYGTGCFVLMNIGDKPTLSKHNLLTTVAWQLENHPPVYALEGSVFVAGAAIKWLRDALKIIYSEKESDFYAELAKENEQNLVFVPAFSGLGAPWWDASARGIILGIEASTKREHIVKASLESIAFQTNDLLNAMASDLGYKITSIKADGGIVKSNYLMQFQADIADVIVSIPKNKETTAVGVCFLAGLACGFWKDIHQLEKLTTLDKKFKSTMDPNIRKTKINSWHKAVERALKWKEID